MGQTIALATITSDRLATANPSSNIEIWPVLSRQNSLGDTVQIIGYAAGAESVTWILSYAVRQKEFLQHIQKDVRDNPSCNRYEEYIPVRYEQFVA